MTNKEFFIKTVESERERFKAAIEALPEEKLGHKVHDKSRDAGSLASQLAIQWAAMSQIITTGKPEFAGLESGKLSKADMLASFDKNFDQMLKDAAAVSDQEWENGDAAMGEIWKDKKYNMVWGFLFDAIHHRGQLSSFLRNMGEKVPSIYGPTADTKM